MIVSEKLPWFLVPSSKSYTDTNDMKPDELGITSANNSTKTNEPVDSQSRKIYEETQYQSLNTLRSVDVFV